MLPKMKGKYIAYCEGDDYWIDENKLQLQYDIMERYSDVYILTLFSTSGFKLNPSYILNSFL